RHEPFAQPREPALDLPGDLVERNLFPPRPHDQPPGKESDEPEPRELQQAAGEDREAQRHIEENQGAGREQGTDYEPTRPADHPPPTDPGGQCGEPGFEGGREWDGGHAGSDGCASPLLGGSLNYNPGRTRRARTGHSGIGESSPVMVSAEQLELLRQGWARLLRGYGVALT